MNLHLSAKEVHRLRRKGSLAKASALVYRGGRMKKSMMILSPCVIKWIIYLEQFEKITKTLAKEGKKITFKSIGEERRILFRKRLTYQAVEQIFQKAFRAGLLKGVSFADARKHGGILKTWTEKVLQTSELLGARKMTQQKFLSTLAGPGSFTDIAHELKYCEASLGEFLRDLCDERRFRTTSAAGSPRATAERRFLLAEVARRRGWVSKISPDALPGTANERLYAIALIKSAAKGKTIQSLSQKLGMHPSNFSARSRVLCQKLGIQTCGGQQWWGEGANYNALKKYVKAQLGRGKTPNELLRYALTRELLEHNKARLGHISPTTLTSVRSMAA